MSIYLKIKKNFGTFKLNVEFEAKNEIMALLGASGCGKSITPSVIGKRARQGRRSKEDSIEDRKSVV